MKNVKLYKNYILYKDGRVYSEKRQGSKGHFVAMSPNTHGYLSFKIWRNGKCYNKQVHRELSKAFIKNPKNLRCVNHKDGVKLNNKLENLEWCTHSQNNMHAYRTGLRKAKSSSGYKYITFESQTEMWRVSVSLGNSKIVKGQRHKTIKLALIERDNILKKYGK